MAGRFSGIRARVTIITLAVTALAMAGVVALASYASWSAVDEIIDHSLVERLDRAEKSVAQGMFQEAIDLSGIDLLQVIDANGKVISSTSNIEGYSAIAGNDDDRYEVDDLEFDEDRDDDDDDDDRDDDDGDGDDDDDDSDDDDGDDDHAVKPGKTETGSTATIGLWAEMAPAAEPGDVHSVVASNVLGTPGPFLVIKRKVGSPIGPITLAAMTSLAPAVETARQTAVWVATLLAALLALAGLFSWCMTGRTLQPVDQMRRDVEAISAQDLHGRITPPANDPDLARLAETFNGLLARIQVSVDERKRFVSDASHELKSPIAATEIILETLREHPESIDEAEALADLSAENARISRIVNDLLMLARQDEGRLAVDAVPIDFYDMLFEEVASLRQRYPVNVDDTGVQPLIGTSDPRLLSHAVRNLLDNAAHYASSTVAVSCCEKDGKIRITVSDDGPGIPEEDRERVFGRFVRLESSRDRASGSTGLGLSVARGIIERLGGAIWFAEPEIGGATAVIELP